MKRFLALGALALLVRPAIADTRSIEFVHTHTGKTIEAAYQVDGVLVPDVVESLNEFLGDHRNGQVIAMDPALFDLLWELRERAGVEGPYHLVSGYRSPETNEMLRKRGRGVAKKSLHMRGQAIDVRLPGVSTAKLRDLARQLGVGGVGYYKDSDFIHVDTGRVRFW
ncbi:MAG: DUF882 domain-containing protein [Pseudomonadota bacterium]